MKWREAAKRIDGMQVGVDMLAGGITDMSTEDRRVAVTACATLLTDAAFDIIGERPYWSTRAERQDGVDEDCFLFMDDLRWHPGAAEARLGATVYKLGTLVLDHVGEDAAEQVEALRILPEHLALASRFGVSPRDYSYADLRALQDGDPAVAERYSAWHPREPVSLHYYFNSALEERVTTDPALGGLDARQHPFITNDIPRYYRPHDARMARQPGSYTYHTTLPGYEGFIRVTLHNDKVQTIDLHSCDRQTDEPGELLAQVQRDERRDESRIVFDAMGLAGWQFEEWAHRVVIAGSSLFGAHHPMFGYGPSVRNYLYARPPAATE